MGKTIRREKRDFKKKDGFDKRSRKNFKSQLNRDSLDRFEKK